MSPNWFWPIVVGIVVVLGLIGTVAINSLVR